mgnify:CR=1 FL=1
MARTAIVCTDGSPLASHAARSGLAVLGEVDEVVVVTVVEPVDLALGAQVSGFAGTTLSPEEVDRARRSMQEEAESVVGGLAQQIGPHARTQVLEGDPGRVICDIAAQAGADVIVMGTRGRGGVKRALLGSVSDHVVRHAPCPVLITNASDDGEASADG